MTQIAVHTMDAPQPGGRYSQGREANGFLFTAGLGPQHPVTGEIAETIFEQTGQVLRNIQAILAERGLTLDDCIKATVHLANLEDFAEFNSAYEEFFNEPYPVRTTVGSQLAGIRVEIDVIAVLPPK
ncbi:MAG: Rid family hydrolase [Actinomycetota bacterium]|nr:Rid family hydrolase [Actinomycetota bacterium]